MAGIKHLVGELSEELTSAACVGAHTRSDFKTLRFPFPDFLVSQKQSDGHYHLSFQQYQLLLPMPVAFS
jgi:hypothetical protein